MKRRTLLAATAAALLPTPRLGAQELPKLRIVGGPVDSFKTVMYALDSGLFRKYGVEVTTTILGAGAAAAAALVGGATDVAGVSALTVFQAHLRGVPMQYLVPSILITSDRPTTQTLVPTNSPVKTGRDLIGKTIGSTTVGDINTAATLAWIDSTGGDSKTVKVIEVPPPSAVAVLNSGRADAVTLNEPIVGQVLASGDARSLAHPYDVIGKRLQVAGWTVMAPFAEKNADAMVRFARAMHESALYTNAHDAQTVEITASFTKIPPDVIAKSIRMRDPEYNDPALMQPIIDTLAKYGFLASAFPASEIISPLSLKPGGRS